MNALHHIVFVAGLLLSANSCLGQTLATQLLFVQSRAVVLGVVESIDSSSADGEGNEIYLEIRTQKNLKGNIIPEGAKIGLSWKQLYIVDTTISRWIDNTEIQITQDSTYLFFLHNLRVFYGEEETGYYADMTNGLIQGIPYNGVLEGELEAFDEPSNNSVYKVPDILLFLSKSSAASVMGRVVKIVDEGEGVFTLTLVSKQSQWTIKKVGLDCIGNKREITVGEEYLCFLDSLDGRTFWPADKWLGVIKTTPTLKQFMKEFSDRFRR